MGITTKKRVIIFRGFGGKIFSTGMDRLGEKLTQYNFDTAVNGYESWFNYYTEIKDKEEPPILIGHSFGALACYKIVSSLPAQTFPLVVSFDYSPYYSGIIGHSPDGTVPTNVKKALNFYQTVDPVVQGVRMEALNNGTIVENVLTEYAHVEIDKADELHQRVIKELI